MSLAFKQIVAEVEKLQYASLERIVVEHVGGIKKRITPVVTEMAPASASGSEIAEKLFNQQVIVSWGLFGGRQYGSLADLDGRLDVKASADENGLVYTVGWTVSNHWLNFVARTVHYSYTVKAVKATV